MTYVNNSTSDAPVIQPTSFTTPLPQEYGFNIPSFPAIEDSEKHLGNIHKLLIEWDKYLRTRLFPPESQDIFKVVSLYKNTFGPNFIPDKQGRMYTLVYALQTTNIVVTSILAPPTSSTIPAGKWVNLNFPDGTSFILDSIATANELKIYVRYTMVSNNNDGPTVP